MELLPRQPSFEGPAERFTGQVFVDVLYAGEDPPRLRVNSVHFTPGARTAWHSHTAGQTLYVTEGVGLVQSRGSEVVEIRPGDVVHTPPGEWHWHGATAEHFMTHLAMWEAPPPGDDVPESEWGEHEHVTDEEYPATPPGTRG